MAFAMPLGKPFHSPKALDHNGKALFNKKLWSLSDEQGGADWATDKAPGTNTEKAYSELDLKAPASPIIVAVIDSGFDMGHPDLEGQWAVNEAELNGVAGVDDDGNGYVDDIKGWNFLGDTIMDTMEITREKVRLEKMGSNISAEDRAYLGKITEAYPAMLRNYVECMNPADVVPDEQIVGNNNPNLPSDEGAHGTHVSGIIAAVRDNFDTAGKPLGVQGQASPFVKILPIRAVPGCDERDFNVAKAIRYAADRGARVVNMSFGKGFQSPKYPEVQKAIQYAESKGVLLVHAAGNSAANNDTTPNFPSSVLSKIDRLSGMPSGEITRAPNWLEVGASGEFANEHLIERGSGFSWQAFTNFGKSMVDLFAPGIRIRSTVPNNQYAEYDGTSMASPNAAGVAALVVSQDPTITVEKLREVLRESVNVSYADQKVKNPATRRDVKFGELSSTGGVIDAYAALRKIGVALK